jgi:hypothetical protein
MSQSARVTSIDALQDWKNALAVFQDHAKEAVVTLELEVRRMFDWLDDQRKFWQAEIRRREDEVVQAKSELWRRKNMPIIEHPDCVEQEKALKRAQRRLEEAQEKLEKTRHWGPALKRAVDEYESHGRRLAAILETDVPRSLGVLEQRIGALEAYVALTAPAESRVQNPESKVQGPKLSVSAEAADAADGGGPPQ